MTDLTDSFLVEKARLGDREAFGELIRRYEKKVLALTYRICKNPEDGAEAAQEAFLAAWQALPSFRGDASFSTWLYRLASNSAVNVLRRESKHSGGYSLDDENIYIELPDDTPSPQMRAEQSELREQIDVALHSLSLEHRQILILREVHQLSYDEIAQTLSLDAGTVKSRISRARKKLREILIHNRNFSGVIPSQLIEKEKRLKRKGSGKEDC